MRTNEHNFAQNLFFYAAYDKSQIVGDVSINEEVSSVTMPSNVFYANSCFMFFFSDVLYVYLCTDAAVRFVNTLYICKFKDVCLRFYFISIYMNSSTECCTVLITSEVIICHEQTCR